MQDNLRDFTEHVRNAPTNSASEQFVRMMLERWAKRCPMRVLMQLGQCVIDCRKADLRDEAEQN